MFETHIKTWRLASVGDAISTATGTLLPVIRDDGTPAMLKQLADAEEKNGAALLQWWNGDGAARLYEADADVILMERATGSGSPTRMAQHDEDDAACLILTDIAFRLHAPRPAPPQNLLPLKGYFSALLCHNVASDSLIGHAQREAKGLFESQNETIPLHGDLHHANVLDFRTRGFLAIDPKGLMGERTFEYANILCNPDIDVADRYIARDPKRFTRRLDIICEVAGLERRSLLGWIIAWSGLSAVWFEQNDDPRAAIPLEIARLALTQQSESMQ